MNMLLWPKRPCQELVAALPRLPLLAMPQPLPEGVLVSPSDVVVSQRNWLVPLLAVADITTW